jgi:small subunit ribosomal protein S17
VTDETTNEGIEEPVDSAAEETPAGAETPEAEAEVADEAAAPSVAEGDAVAVVADEPVPDAVEETAPEPEPRAADPESEAAAAAPEEVRRKKRRLPRALRPQRARPKRERPAARKPIVRLPKPEHDRGRRQERRGIVVSSAMDKTIVVEVDTIKAHPTYKKVVRRSTKFHAHDERNEANVGDLVRIVETRPLSKKKHWRLAEILEAAK